jgi:hypothetical protein
MSELVAFKNVIKIRRVTDAALFKIIPYIAEATSQRYRRNFPSAAC